MKLCFTTSTVSMQRKDFIRRSEEKQAAYAESRRQWVNELEKHSVTEGGL